VRVHIRLRYPSLPGALGEFCSGRFCVDERLSAFFVASPPSKTRDEENGGDDLLLLDLQRSGGLSGVLQGACEGPAGGGVASMSLDMARGFLLLRGRRGGLYAHSCFC